MHTDPSTAKIWLHVFDRVSKEMPLKAALFEEDRDRFTDFLGEAGGVRLNQRTFCRPAAFRRKFERVRKRCQRSAPSSRPDRGPIYAGRSRLPRNRQCSGQAGVAYSQIALYLKR